LKDVDFFSLPFGVNALICVSHSIVSRLLKSLVLFFTHDFFVVVVENSIIYNIFGQEKKRKKKTTMWQSLFSKSCGARCCKCSHTATNHISQ
jgi:hypothetical protein